LDGEQAIDETVPSLRQAIDSNMAMERIELSMAKSRVA